LQQQSVVLQGPAWPGQPMTLTIARRQHDGSDAGDTRAEVFETTLTLDLPRLGALQAHLRLSGATVAVSLESPAGSTAAELDAALPGLRTALEAHGLVPVLLQAIAGSAPVDAR
jgi:Flagellar hook-length control protein FliK